MGWFKWGRWLQRNIILPWNGEKFWYILQHRIYLEVTGLNDISKSILLVGGSQSKQIHGGWGKRVFQMGTMKGFWREAVGMVCPVRVALRHTSKNNYNVNYYVYFDNKNYKERTWRDGLAVNSRIWLLLLRTGVTFPVPGDPTFPFWPPQALPSEAHAYLLTHRHTI